MGFLAALPAIASQVATIFGSNDARSSARKESRLNRQLQLDTLQNQIQWRVADAKKAGVHPLYALGATPASYIPSSTNFAPTDYSALGQDISRGLMAGQTDRERRRLAGEATIAATQEAEFNAARIRNLDMETELLRSQIARANSAQLGPGMPVGGVELQPDRVTVGSPGAPERTPGIVPDYSFGYAAPGPTGERFTIVPSYDVKQRIEDMPSEWSWFLRNGIVPSDSIFRDLHRQHPPRPGYEWRFDPAQGQFWQRPLNGRRMHY